MRTVLITGASGGMGRVAAAKYASNGDRLVLADIALAGLESVRDDILAEYPQAEVLPVELDVVSEASVRAAAEAVRAWSGSVDVLALIAGTVQEAAPVLELSTEEWDRVQNVNLRGPFLMCREFVPLMPHDSGASILAVSSWWGREGHPFYSAYCTSKAGVVNFVQCLASELADVGIRVNSVSPGNTDTRMHRAALEGEAESRGITFEEMKDIEWAKIPLKKAGEPRSIVDAVFFLTSDAADYITGATLDVNGGVQFN